MKKIILLLVFLISLGIVNAQATVTLDRPAASGVVAGTYNLSVSLTTELNNLTRAWFYGSSASTGNTSNVLLGTVDATNADNNSQHLDYTEFNSKSGSAGLDDASNYIFTVIAGNSTNNYTDTSTSVIIDNTIPDVNTFYSSSDGAKLYFSAALATSKNVTSCSVRFIGNNPGSGSYTLADGGLNNASYSEQNRVATGTYIFQGSCADGRNTTNSASTNTFTVVTSKGTSGLGGVLSALGGEVTDTNEVIVKGTDTSSPYSLLNLANLKWILMVIGIVAGLIGGLVVPLPIPKQFLMPITTIIFGVAGYYLGYYISILV